MSSNPREHRRRDRSWERDDRERNNDRYPRRRRTSRSRSPRRGDRDRHDPRGYGRERDDHLRQKDRRDDGRDRAKDKDTSKARIDDRRGTMETSSKESPPSGQESLRTDPAAQSSSYVRRPNLDPDAPDDPGNTGDALNAEDGDSAMMAMMGMSGFGTTKGKHVEGNQEGGVNIKKMRTWRQYMNRRGGFNRPLDKIK